MIPQQLELFGSTLKPPKKIKSDVEVMQPPPTQGLEEEKVSTNQSFASPNMGDTISLIEQPQLDDPDISPAPELSAELSQGSPEQLPTLAPESEAQLPAISVDSALPEQEPSASEKTTLQETFAPEEIQAALPTAISQDAIPEGQDTDAVVEINLGINATTQLPFSLPSDEKLFSRQYYTMRETSDMFGINQSMLRFWENEFEILTPRKNRKGDRYFRPQDIKNIQLIYHLLKVRKYTLEGAKTYLKSNHKQAAEKMELINQLQGIKQFLLELKAQLTS